MNSWKLLTVLLVSLALANVLVFAQENADGVSESYEDPADGEVDEVGGADIGAEVDEDAVDPGEEADNEMAVDENEDEDDAAVEEAVQDAVDTVCNSLQDESLDKRMTLSKRGWFSNIYKKVKNTGKKVWGKVKNIAGRVRGKLGKRDIDEMEEDIQELERSLEDLNSAIEEEDVERRMARNRRGWLKKAWKKTKKVGKKAWKLYRKFRPGKRSIEGMDEEEDEEIKRSLEKLNKAVEEEDVERRMALNKRGLPKKPRKPTKKVGKKARKLYRKIKPGKRSIEGMDEEEDEEMKRSLEKLNKAVEEEDVERRMALNKRGWLKKAWKKTKKVGKKAWKLYRKFKPGKRSIEGMDEEEDEEMKRSLEKLNSSSPSQDLTVSKRGKGKKFWRGVKKVWRKVKPFTVLLGKRSEADPADEDTAAKVEQLKDALDVLNTVVDMAESTQAEEA